MNQSWQKLQHTGTGTTAIKGDIEFDKYENDLYECKARRYVVNDGFAMIHISFHRRDREPHIPWRHKQQIKNEIAGAEWEGIELYPAMSRIVDSTNEYHLWCFSEIMDGIGFGHRLLTDRLSVEGSNQEPFDPNLGWEQDSDESIRRLVKDSGLRLLEEE